MRRRDRLRRRRRFRSIVWLLLVAALAVPVGLYALLAASLPQTAGTLRLPGASAIIEVIRDRHGVPHIFAANEGDAWFALGFVHAQDRFYQMEMTRRAGRGRLSEVAGRATLDSDRYLRTLGLLDHAEAALAVLPDDLRRQLDSYAAGVNAYIGQSWVLPPEFLIARLTPEPWTAVDCLLWGQLMGQQLAGNWRDEMARARALARQPAERLEELWQAPPEGSATTLAALDRDLALDRTVLPPSLGPHTASNEWAIAGTLTATGKPLLVNDPHLGLGTPAQWYLARITTPTLQLAGATVPGVPAMILGHNGRIAWGFTTTNADMFDLFIERTDPADPARYLVPGGSEAFTTRSETIRVKGEADVVVTVRRSRHGPVISDAIRALGEAAPVDHVLALSFPPVYEVDRTAAAMFRVNRARNWEEFNAALAQWHMPMQNIVYADTDGHIGFVAPGQIPRRRSGDGRLPRPGWTGEFDWDGFAPFEALPRAFDPPAGWIANANNRVVPDTYPVFITRDWDAPYRAERLQELLQRPAPHTVPGMEMMLADPVSLYARAVLRRVEGVTPTSERAGQALALLRDWDGRASRERPEPLILHAWMRELQRALFADWPADQLGVRGSERPEVIMAALEGRSAFCREQPGGCAGLVAATLTTSVDSLAARHGNDLSAWKWGAAHRAPFRHLVFDRVPVLRGWTAFDVPTDGDSYTINRGAWRPSAGDEPFAHVHGAGYRAVYDLADLANSRFIVAPGQSGHPLSRHWGDLVETWAMGGHIGIGGERAALAAEGRSLRIEPR